MNRVTMEDAGEGLGQGVMSEVIWVAAGENEE